MTVIEVGYRAERCWVRDEQLTDWGVEPPDELPVLALGSCPSCGHATQMEITSSLVAVGMAGEDGPRDDREWITRVFECACEMSHQDSAAPPGDHPSCGRWWLASIRIVAGDGQVVRAAVDDTLLQAARAVQNQVEIEESRLRSSAEKWTAAVTTLLGLFGLSGLIFGKDAFAGLPLIARIVAGILAAAAMALAASAVLNTYKSAYGWPTLIDLGDDQKLRDWYAAKGTKLGAAANELKNGVILALAALAALAVAAALIWFVPRDPARPLITVMLTTDAQVCGQLLDSTDAMVRVRRTNGEVATTPPIQIAAIKVVMICPA